MNIVIVGNYGSTNLGDELILLGLLKELFIYYPEASITIPSALPESSEKLLAFCFPGKSITIVPRIPFGIRSLRKANFSTFRAFKKADLIILGGGGLLADDESVLVPLFWYAQVFPAIFYKKPLVTYGLGIGPLRGRLGRYATKKLLEKTKFLGLRDDASMQLSHKLTSITPFLTVDPIFLLQDGFLDIFQDQSISIPSKPYITLSLRDWNGWNLSMYRIFAQILDRVVDDYGLDICFLPFETYPHSDRPTLDKIFVHLKNKEHIFCPIYDESIDILKNLEVACRLIKNSKFTLAMRLHANLLAATLGTPFLPIIYSEKTHSFLSQNANDFLGSSLSFQDIKLLKPSIKKLESFIAGLDSFRVLQSQMSTKLYERSKNDFRQFASNLKLGFQSKTT